MSDKRVTIKLNRPNPLFEHWLTEWRDRERGKGSKMEKCYATALSSLKKYPLPLSSGKNCIILEGFGRKLCKMLDDRLQSSSNTINTKPLCPQQALTGTSELKLKSFKDNASGCGVEQVQGTSYLVERQASDEDTWNNREYTPGLRSGAYAILIALYQDSLEEHSSGRLTKEEIKVKAQPFCDKSFEKSATGGSYTAWSCMSSLLGKGMVLKEGNPARYSLTDPGIITAHKLFKNRCAAVSEQSVEPIFNGSTGNSAIKTVNPILAQLPVKGKKAWKKQASTSLASESGEDGFAIQPGAFDVILLVDTQETSGASRKNEDPIIHELEKTRVAYEVRHLKIGDYLWIARERSSGKELVLPYIVERKRVDDFGASIKDGRFHEQKFRLKQSGLPGLIYLVENCGTRHTGLPLSTLQQAATNTLVQEGFIVKFTEQLKGTIEYLSNFSRIVTRMYQDKTLIRCAKKDFIKTDLFSLINFKEFNLASSKIKSFKVRQLFVKQLLQLKGVSVDKALAIVEAYPTPASLRRRYSECTQKEGENLLAGLQFGKLRKNMGPVISKTVYQLFNFNSYQVEVVMV